MTLSRASVTVNRRDSLLFFADGQTNTRQRFVQCPKKTLGKVNFGHTLLVVCYLPSVTLGQRVCRRFFLGVFMCHGSLSSKKQLVLDSSCAIWTIGNFIYFQKKCIIQGIINSFAVSLCENVGLLYLCFRQGFLLVYCVHVHQRN